jgi:outer membrane murein-binding lipoprotein Lpp
MSSDSISLHSELERLSDELWELREREDAAREDAEREQREREQSAIEWGGSR